MDGFIMCKNEMSNQEVKAQSACGWKNKTWAKYLAYEKKNCIRFSSADVIKCLESHNLTENWIK